MRVKQLVRACITSTAFFGALLILQAASAMGEGLAKDLEPRSLADALDIFAAQTGLQVVYQSEIATGLTSGAAKAGLSADETLRQLLRGTGLTFEFLNERTIAVIDAAAPRPSASRLPVSWRQQSHLAQAEAGATTPAAGAQEDRAANSPNTRSAQPARSQDLPRPEETGKAIPEVLVLGGKSLNMDIKRSRDDIQPYAIFERQAIERSGAHNLEGFLKQRLTMNTAGRSNSQVVGTVGNASQINLRGLGTNQTLILIDGHRTPPINSSGQPFQTDINGIPLEAIERIEVLPTTASAIYGGSATGGVVNIVLRRDYAGFESKLTYENGFDSDSSSRRVDVSGGFNLEGGKTNILIAGSYSDANDLLVRERDFVHRGRTALQANNPPGFFPPTTPPLGTTTNIRSAQVVGGVLQNLTLDDGTPLNSTFTSVPAGYAGATTDAGQAFLANAGVYNLELANSAQAGGARASLLNAPIVESGMVTLRRQFADRLQLFLDASATNNTGYLQQGLGTSTFTIPANAPNNPFQQAIQVRAASDATDGVVEVSDNDRRAVAGAIYQLPGDWTAGADYTWDRARHHSFTGGGYTAAASTAVASGSIDVLRDLNAFPADFSPFIAPPTTITPAYSTLKDATVRAAGPIGHLPGGAPTVSALLEYRDEELDETSTFFSSGATSFIPSRSQTVKSVYLEARVPVVSHLNSKPALQELELQVSGRHDAYSVNGVTSTVTVGSNTPIDRATNDVSSTDYTVGLRYSPVRDVALRGSYGTGFLPPSVTQVVSTPFNFVISSVNDPRRGNTPAGPAGTTIPTLFGGNPNLGPEESESWSAGIVLTPRFIPGLRLSVDYEKIDKTNNIATFGPQFALNNESLLPGRVIRDPAARNPTDPPDWADPVVFIDFTSLNIAQAQVEAYDIQLDYSLETTRFGSFDFFAIATQQTHYKTQIIPGAPVMENVGVNADISIPLKTKANGGLMWTYRQWMLGWSAQYFDSYRVSTNPTTIANQGNDGLVPSQTYHDVVGSYRFDSSGWLLSDLELQVGLKNVFGEAPPFDASNTSTFYSFLGDPRLRSYYISLRKGF